MKRTLHAQQGFTIIEMLVALTISIILLMGVLEIFSAGKRSYKLQGEMSRLQENARYAMDIMANSISRAGLDTGTTQIFPFAEGTRDGPLPVVTDAIELKYARSSDSIEVRYASGTDCLGAATPAVGYYKNVAEDFFAINDQSQLTCNGSPIVDGIEHMQILYGLDTKKFADLHTAVDGIPERYVPYSSLPATILVVEPDPAVLPAGQMIPNDENSDTGGVTSVRIALLVSSVRDPSSNLSTLLDEDLTTYRLLNGPLLPAFGEFGTRDNKIRRIFTRTILLRNYVVQPKNPQY